MKKYLFVLLPFLFVNFIFGQGQAAVPFLNLQQSPFLYGAGQIGAAIPSNDAIGFYYNPAQLGYFSINNNLAISFLPQKTAWFNNLYSNTTYQNYGFSAGYNFYKKNNELPLSVGIGYIHNKIDYGNFLSSDFTNPNQYYSDHSYDSFDCISLGASYKYYLIFNLGFSLNIFNSIMGLENPAWDLGIGNANGTAWNFGAMVITPVSELLFNNAEYKLYGNSFIKPVVNFTLGYSLMNVGNKIFYIDRAQSDPIPRTARLGYSVDLGVDMSVDNREIKAVNYSFTAEAEDLLIKNNNYTSFEYKGILGGINFGRNLIGLSTDNSVVVHKGHILRLFESVILISGRYYGGNLNNIKTGGYGLSSEGIEKLLSMTFNNRVLDFIAGHFTVEFYNTNCFEGTGYTTNFKGLSFYLKNFSL